MGVFTRFSRLGRVLKPTGYDFNFIWDLLINLANVTMTVPTIVHVRVNKLINMRSIIAELGLISLYTSTPNPNYEDLRYVMMLYETNNTS
ncbi:MAG: hypothetical protein ACP5L1_03860 [Caldivirga sp.]|uniref:hypothetical protein n=1 Tax=Caldivirga sp. TaxID=2080243 RepID=UPI003D096115